MIVNMVQDPYETDKSANKFEGSMEQDNTDTGKLATESGKKNASAVD